MNSTATLEPDAPAPISVEKLNILRHAIGINDDGSDRYPHARSADERRNHFTADPESIDGIRCRELCAAEYMHDHGPQKMMGLHLYQVTDEGKDLVHYAKRRPKI